MQLNATFKDYSHPWTSLFLWGIALDCSSSSSNVSAGLAFGLPSTEVEPGSKREEGLPPVESGKPSPIPTLRKFPRAAVASDGEQSLPSGNWFILMYLSICWKIHI